ncbi:MAG: hypothetical protein HY681_11175 [Chloroflexi bacterium]|nr:hypothetical protein [Chloroflexota bacterium]
MSQATKQYGKAEIDSLREQFLRMADPTVSSYVASLRRKYRRYAMPVDDARKIVDAAMGDKCLTDLLYEARS